MKIRQWYRFKDKYDRLAFLAEYNELLRNNGQEKCETSDVILYADCLCITEVSLDNTKKYKLCYRTNYIQQYMPYVIFYERNNNKGDNMNTSTILTLIDKKAKNDINALEEKYIKLRNDVILESDISQKLEEYAKIIADRSSDDVRLIKLKTLCECHLNDTDKAAIATLRKEYDEKLKEISSKYDELKCLVQSADNFSQAYTLLKAYNVINIETDI